ncbi:MAG: sialate O-acetylesterase [Colwellia sp.]
MKKYILLIITMTLIACTNTLLEKSTTKATDNAQLKLSVPLIFNDHMILQRNKPIKVWGWAEPNKLVKVTLQSNKQPMSPEAQVSAETQVNAQGKWLITLPAQKTGNVQQLIISTDETTLTFNDVLIGDVWLASGQSNMEWKLGWKVDNWQQEVANSSNNHIRFFEVETEFKATEQEKIKGGKWQIANPETAANFSAVAWYFAKLNNSDKKVPVAIIDSTWGGTPAEAWLSLPALSKVPGYEKQALSMINNPKKWQNTFKQNSKNEVKKWQIIADESYYADGKVLSLSFDDSAWQNITLPTAPEQPLSDIAWLRKSFTLDSLPNTAELSLGEMNQIGKVFLNGELIYQEDWQDTTKAVTIPVSTLKQGKNILALRVINSWDNKINIGKPDQLWLKFDDKKYNLQGNWRFSNTFEPKFPVVKNYNWEAAVLYNAMINPIANYTIKGVIWYQGESNSGQPHLYANLFKALIQDWRQQFQQPELPFLFVQLASYLQQQAQPKESQWAELRQAQTDALALANTGMAVTLDIGNADDIHPRNKADVGKRLWLAAKHVAFNEHLVYSGPIFSSMKIKTLDSNNGLLITYQDSGNGLQTNSNEVLGFAIAGKDNNFVNAQAKIINNEIFVYSEKIKKPTAVRYGWADNSPANIVNSSLLPAVPFQHTLP